LPEPDSVESVQLQFCDDSCTVSKVVDITDDNKSVITELIESNEYIEVIKQEKFKRK
jgi:hypothetical protein